MYVCMRIDLFQKQSSHRHATIFFAILKNVSVFEVKQIFWWYHTPPNFVQVTKI